MDSIKIPFFKPIIGKEEEEAVISVLRSGWTTFGEQGEAFEEEFAEFVSAPYAVFVMNCTVALIMALECLNMRGWDIAVTPWTCAPDPLAIIRAGANPVFMDIDKKTLCMQPIYKLPSLPVHYAGQLCVQPNPVVHDCAHMLYRNCYKDLSPQSCSRKMACFSLFATKVISSGGQGGMICCDSKKDRDWFRQCRNLGISHARFLRDGSSNIDFESKFVGMQTMPTDMQAAVGRVQLRKAQDFWDRRIEIREKYNKAFGIEWGGTYLYEIEVPEGKVGEFIAKMKEEKGIGCSIDYPPQHLEPAYKQYMRAIQYKDRCEIYKIAYNISLPIAEGAAKRTVSLPIYPAMSDEDVQYVILSVKDILSCL